jgi:Tfp pilus assembly protein PilV
MLNNFFYSRANNQRGYTLLELVFALGILIMVIAAIAGLTRSSLVGYYESEQKSIATHLGQEALEVVRVMRDTNWLRDLPAFAGISDGDGTASVVFDRTTADWSLNFAVDSLDDEGALIYQTSILNGSVYNQSAEGAPTQFRRLVSLSAICFDESTNQESISDNCGSERRIGIQVSVVVRWTERGARHESAMKTLLYDWR